MTITTTPLCTDEDLACRAPTDFPLICPPSGQLAAGKDGVVFAIDPWRLHSATNAFGPMGVGTGNVVSLRLSPPSNVLTSFAVVSADDSSVVLRRVGLGQGVGLAPGSASDLSAVGFAIGTAAPQILAASYDLDQRFGISDRIPGVETSQLFDASQLCLVCVLTTLYGLYVDASRGSSEGYSGSPGRPDVWLAKAAHVKAELDDRLSRLSLDWNRRMTAGGPTSAPTTAFSTRISR